MTSIFNFRESVDIFGAERVEEARRYPAVRHFEGGGANKPWHYMCDHPMREAYFEHRRQTPWPNVKLEGRTPGNVLRRLARTLARSPAQEGAHVSSSDINM